MAALVSVLTGDFAPYPGARSEPWLDKYRNEANAALARISRDQPQAQMWITNDSFEKVREFYAKRGVEDTEFGALIAKTMSDSTKRKVFATYVVFDGAGGAVLSRYYLAIQRPVVVAYHPLDVRDVTLISLYQQR